ncbi:MAG: hypothetical protein MPJ50_04360 [Pirellulales bacterium]|nr:hypothetical protein [Pirellulales bacterium]
MAKKNQEARRAKERSQRGSPSGGKSTRKRAGQRDKSPRRSKSASEPRNAAGIQELAQELRAMADTIDSYAQAMRDLKIESIRPLTGNWNLAMTKLRDVINKQILARLLVESARLGYEAHELFKK